MKQDNNFLRGIKSLVQYNKSSHNGQTMEIRIDAVEKLIKEAERAERNKQALEFYADKKTYELSVKISMGTAFPCHEPIKYDKGEIARKALDGKS
ncbi:hypothetical protein [Caldifermentibacillus hisashii]|uniref:hypothetical protein n=1 Tax=Caldifermentibacillus hisashii TaxID=996558 RepID=UPI001C126779|nr:hypothetical protein [Caldifermentibacillus hisashii]MBU5342310.1 hypothetical protein [Caldifermentibacillus hisashii]